MAALTDDQRETLISLFRMQDFNTMFMLIDQQYRQLGFRDPLTDSERIAEYKYITQQLRKYIAGRQDPILACGSNLDAMKNLVCQFKRLGLYDRYAVTLERVVKYRLSDILATQFHRKDKKDFEETAANMREYLSYEWPGMRSARYIAWGGYNLGRELVHLPLLNEPQLRFSFSSLISLLGEGGERCIDHKNRYREIMLQREENRTFFKYLESVKPEYLFIDLLEERFDILERDGRFVTQSDAREGAQETGSGFFSSAAAAVAPDGRSPRVIPRNSQECMELFRKACRLFAEKTAEISPETRIVVVENELCTDTGTVGRIKRFPDHEKIKEKNTILSGMYDLFFSEICKTQTKPPVRIPVSALLRNCDPSLMFTDEKYEYGAVPSHLNELANRRLAAYIQETLEL